MPRNRSQIPFGAWRACGLLLIAWWALSGGAARGADDARLEQALAALLTAGWDVRPDGLTTAQEHHAAAIAVAPTDTRVDMAMGLVYLKRQKYDEARGAFDSALGKHRGNLAAWRAAMWIPVLRRDPGTAWAKMRALADIYPNRPVADAIETDLRQTAGFMGRLVGFLANTAATPAAATEVSQNAEPIAAKLAGERRKAFDEGRLQIDEQFKSARQELDRTRDADADDQRKKKEQDLDEVERERARLRDESEQLKSQADEAEETRDRKVADVDSKLRPLQRRFDDMRARAEPMVRLIQDLERQADLMRASARRRNPRGEIEIDIGRMREAEFLERRANDERIRLRPLETEMQRTQLEGQRLEADRNAALQSYQSTLTRLNSQRDRLQKSDKKLVAIERLARTPATGDTTRVLGQEAKLTALTNYERYPLDAERQRLLDSFRK